MNQDAELRAVDVVILDRVIRGWKDYPLWTFTDPVFVAHEGETVTLGAADGPFAKHVLIFLVRVDGVAVPRLVAQGRFGWDLEYDASWTLPPGTAGIELEFRSYTIDAAGKVLASNHHVLAIK